LFVFALAFHGFAPASLKLRRACTRGYYHDAPCGGLRREQSLVVWAISEGREAARGVDAYLMGRTFLPTKGEGDLPRV